jgi:hypothetical protein
MFESQIAHEKTHARQYLKKKRRPESIDEVSDWEQEAYANELDKLLQGYTDSGC